MMHIVAQLKVTETGVLVINRFFKARHLLHYVKSSTCCPFITIKFSSVSGQIQPSTLFPIVLMELYKFLFLSGGFSQMSRSSRSRYCSATSSPWRKQTHSVSGHHLWQGKADSYCQFYYGWNPMDPLLVISNCFLFLQQLKSIVNTQEPASFFPCYL